MDILHKKELLPEVKSAFLKTCGTPCFAFTQLYHVFLEGNEKKRSALVHKPLYLNRKYFF